MFYGVTDDYASFRSGCAGVDCDGPYGYAMWVSLIIVARAGSSET
ncbi:hypothetical protein CEV34_0070 [Brucella pseudogrignonensis]|uniref:Uncharacterized protein n=1 Tax=Brucella pseudogrignonensis TaxID=419475 RepID=A0A256GWI6_9HYPH|nr:hypothetical protein CEV34_0070 [Brucella pseudogrignonensis]